MPIYEYCCAKCGAKFEKMGSISTSSQPVPCPKCKGKGERRLSRCAFSMGGSDSGYDMGGAGESSGGGGGCGSCGGGSCASCGH